MLKEASNSFHGGVVLKFDAFGMNEYKPRRDSFSLRGCFACPYFFANTYDFNIFTLTSLILVALYIVTYVKYGINRHIGNWGRI